MMELNWSVSNLEEVLALAARHGVTVHLHFHGLEKMTERGHDHSAMPVLRIPIESMRRGAPGQLDQTVLSYLRKHGKTKKNTLIREVFGGNFSQADGLKVTRSLQELQRLGFVDQISFGYWAASHEPEPSNG